MGITVPKLRQISKSYGQLSFSDLKILLNSKIHEHRLLALFILIRQYQKADDSLKTKIFDFYRQNLSCVNNWDLVDLSAPNILGDYLFNHPSQSEVVNQLVTSKNLWFRRVAIISTLAFIRHNNFRITIRLAKILLRDNHDLIHKAVGWMLREVGNRDQKIERQFLDRFASQMPRTMLRYAIEKFPEEIRQQYLKK